MLGAGLENIKTLPALRLVFHSRTTDAAHEVVL